MPQYLLSFTFQVIPDAIDAKQSPIPQPFTREARKAQGQLHKFRKNLPVSQPAKGLLSPENDNPCTPLLSSINPWYCQVTWILFNINTSLAPIISVVYWSLVHDFTSGDKTNIFSLAGISNIQVHALNIVVVFIDLMVSAYPVKIVHCIFTMGLGLIYVVFSLIYWAAGGLNPMNGTRALYPILNWEKIPGLSCLFLLGVIVIMVLVQCGIYGLYRLRFFMVQRLSSTLESKQK
ncbi:protein rolling stone-like [Strongylocentrotus purpuratus]|uniref:Uncharacterized protein n=1 Tax=Strongylocentrotus purpuratus TaxID=7668 RepID=A0A7M7P8G5_STRPU|nr:protein rolling stone-like [Strongylocentrotus purpuratus]